MKKSLKNRINSLLISVVTFTTIFGCSASFDFSNSITLSMASWQAQSPYSILFRSNKELDTKELVLLINTNSKFGIDSIPVVIEITNPQREIWSDTISIDLSMVKGKREKQYNEIILAHSCSFADSGIYKFKIRNNSDKNIEGVEEIGIAIK